MVWDGNDRRSDSPLRDLHQRLDDHLKEEKNDSEKLGQIEARLANLEASMGKFDELIKLMEQIKGAMGFIKIIAAIIAAGAATWSFMVSQFKDHWK